MFSTLRRQTISIGIAALIIVLLLWLAGIFDFAELRAIDTAFALRGAIPPQSPVVIVAIDDESLTQTGNRWPWSRTYFAELINALANDQPSVIALDVLFYEAQPGDDVLAHALQRAGNVVLANSISVVSDPAFRLEQLNLPVSPLAESAAAIGLSNFPLDRDGFARRVLAYQTHSQQQYFHWAIQTAALHLHATPRQTARDQIVLGAHIVPLDDQTLAVNYRGAVRTFKTIPAYQITRGDLAPGFFKDKIVLIGATTQTLHDTYPTPFRGDVFPMPGVEIGANVIETILTKQYIRELPFALALLLVLAASALGFALNWIPRALLSWGILLGAVIAFTAIWFALFSIGNFQMPFIVLIAAGLATFIAPSVERAITAETERRRVRRIFEQFISPEVVNQLLAGGIAQSYGKRARVTILFSDIRGFTKLSEELAPDEIVNILNEYLAAMTDVIFQHGGTIDKFEGDALIAFWGAPMPDARHAVRALDAAIAMQKELARLRSKWLEKYPQYKFEIGIGVNTGEAFVGLIGSHRRVNYTVIGDHANLAARLQDLTKEYRWPLLISEATYREIEKEFDAEFLDAKIVKGKSVPVNVYRVLGRRGAPESEMIYSLVG